MTQPMPLAALMQRGMPTTASEPVRQAPISDNDARTVAMMFEQLKIVFPAWKHAFPTEQAQRRALAEWTRALVDAGCTSREQLQLGMQVARQQTIPFFPAPGMFIQWCEMTPEALGLPTVDQALADIARHRKTHPAVVLAARATKWERQTLSADKYREVFAQAYEQLLRRVVKGEDLAAEVLKGLPTQSQIQHSPEFYQQAGQRGVASLKALLRGRSVNGEGV
ncbi:MAG: hypothetical protein LRY38_01535 [Aeromonadaceae bacterium]|nr:hypothetical protein [Aeromonadaceae bacterium]